MSLGEIKFTNLWTAYNRHEDFRVLICADDEEQAGDIVREYAYDSGLTGEWEISPAEAIDDTKFDCDYVLTEN